MFGFRSYSKTCKKPYITRQKNITVKYDTEELCDGIVHCPDAEDEDFDMCKERKAFPDSATLECESFAGKNVTILATECNGQTECKSGEDEKNCGDSYSVYIVLGTCLLASLLLSYAVLYLSKVKKVVKEIDVESSDNEELEVLVVNSQKSTQRKTACKVLFQRKMTEHDGNRAEAINELKVTLTRRK